MPVAEPSHQSFQLQALEGLPDGHPGYAVGFGQLHLFQFRTRFQITGGHPSPKGLADQFLGGFLQGHHGTSSFPSIICHPFSRWP